MSARGIVLIGGSLRPDSLNRRLMAHLARELELRGQGVRVFQGEDLRLPLYAPDQDAPLAVEEMTHALRQAAGLVVVSPEYNAGIPGHLKNAIDWLSTQQPNPFTGLRALVATASPGAFGGVRSVGPWRMTLANLGCWVAPAPITVPRAEEALDPLGTPREARTATEVVRALESFLAGPR